MTHSQNVLPIILMAHRNRCFTELKKKGDFPWQTVNVITYVSHNQMVHPEKDPAMWYPPVIS